MRVAAHCFFTRPFDHDPSNLLLAVFTPFVPTPPALRASQDLSHQHLKWPWASGFTSAPQLPFRKWGDNITYFIGLLSGLNELLHKGHGT